MSQIPYAPHQKFICVGTTYRMVSITPHALEVRSNATQSLWVAIAELERLLGIHGRAGLFTWHMAQRGAA